jgi:hypothetical protein
MLKYIVRGRTDLVVLFDAKWRVGKRNNRYFIEIKTKKGFKLEPCLREAVVQLIGGNAANPFHSPPVLLTDLFSNHYVLFITMVGDPKVELKFELNVFKMDTFGSAIAFVEEKTLTKEPITRDMARKPTPLSSPPRKDDDDDDEFVHAYIEEIVGSGEFK